MTHSTSSRLPIALVVDDEPLIEMEAVDLFHDLGYEAIGARNADEAMRILRARDDVALVFTDIEMPGTMNGLVLAAIIEATWPSIQVLITSGRTTTPDEMLLGRARFLPKPYDRKQIEASIGIDNSFRKLFAVTKYSGDPIQDRQQVDRNRPTGRHHVVIVGAGFGGLEAVHRLAGTPISITLIDQRNHHLFQPLLYQVATASLATSEIAWPIRYLLRGRPEVTTLLATVVGVDADARRVMLDGGEAVTYDTLVLATGARHAYFGHDEWEPFALGLKTLEDATTIRRRILLAFERAERETDPRRQAALLTFVIIGAGPTGVELAGTIAELARDTLAPDFRNIDTRKARVVLIEAGPRVLAGYPDDLSAYAQHSLESLGVEVELGQPVTDCTAEGVVYGGRSLQAKTIIWAAGVQASPAAEWLGAPADRAGRLLVRPDLTVPGHPDVFAIGDTVTIPGPNGKPVPGIAPAAKQQGSYVAESIRARLSGDAAVRPFRYHHDGSLAQIGKRRAVIDFGWIKLRGSLAWWIWGIAHIYFLIGVRNRLSVALSWLWIYVRNQRSARLITQGQNDKNAGLEDLPNG